MKGFFFIGLLLVTTYPPTISALNTGPSKYPVNSTIPLELSVKLWGYKNISNNLIVEMNEKLPRTVYLESSTPKNSTVDQYDFVISNRLRGLRLNVNYQFEMVQVESGDADAFLANLILERSTVKSVNQLDLDGVARSYNGSRIAMNDMANYLDDYNSQNEYTIHLLDLTLLQTLTNQSYHWYDLGVPFDQPPDSSDMRNLGLVSNKSLFYDPTAISPRYSDFVGLYVNNSIFTQTEIIDNLKNIIEQIIIGSPYTNPFTPLKKLIHVAEILIGAEPNDDAFEEANTKISSERVNFRLAVAEMFPYLEITTSTVSLTLDRKPDILSAITDSQVSGGGLNFVNVTGGFAEKMKNLIRDDKQLYSDFPHGWFYGIVSFVDSDTREYVYQAKDGIQAYEAQEIGLGILNLKEFRSLSDIAMQRYSIVQQELRIFGKMLGMHEITNLFVSQIESPMSSDGVPVTWGRSFNQFEIDSVARRYSAVFNHTVWVELISLRTEIEESNYRFLDLSSFDKVEEILIQGNIQTRLGNYVNAANSYVEGYESWVEARDDILEKRNGLDNSVTFAFIILIMIAVIDILRGSVITRKVFINRMTRKNTKEN